MAGSWIKFRHDLIDAPEIRRLARACGVTRDDVYGKLFRLWSWFDRHSHSGRVAEETGELVDEIVGHSGFASALVSVGWLSEDQYGIVIPNWDRHNSETAKQRALDAARKAAARDQEAVSGKEPDRPPDTCPANTRTREEKRREELPPLPHEGFDKQAWQALRKAWNAGPGKTWKLVNPPAKAVERLSDPDWIAMAMDAIAKLRSCRFFDSPVTLNQFCGPEFVTNVLGGTYDEPKGSSRKGRDFGDQPPPPRAFTGDAADAFERTRRKLASKEGIA